MGFDRTSEQIHFAPHSSVIDNAEFFGGPDVQMFEHIQQDGLACVGAMIKFQAQWYLAKILLDFKHRLVLDSGPEQQYVSTSLACSQRCTCIGASPNRRYSLPSIYQCQ